MHHILQQCADYNMTWARNARRHASAFGMAAERTQIDKLSHIKTFQCSHSTRSWRRDARLICTGNLISGFILAELLTAARFYMTSALCTRSGSAIIALAIPQVLSHAMQVA